MHHPKVYTLLKRIQMRAVALKKKTLSGTTRRMPCLCWLEYTILGKIILPKLDYILPKSSLNQVYIVKIFTKLSIY